MASLSSLKLIALGGISKAVKGTQKAQDVANLSLPGASYTGTSKIQQGDSYKLINQTAKYYSDTINGITVDIGTTRTVTRPTAAMTDFYLKMITISYYTGAGEWNIYDTQTGFLFMVYIATETGGYGSQRIEFPVPIRITGNMQIVNGGYIIPAHKIITQFWGWEEQKP